MYRHEFLFHHFLLNVQKIVIIITTFKVMAKYSMPFLQRTKIPINKRKPPRKSSSFVYKCSLDIPIKEEVYLLLI